MIGLLVFWAATQAAFTYFLDFTFQPGNIFAFYMKWVKRNFSPQIAKPLGDCPYCFNIWVAIPTFAILVYFAVLPWYLFLPFTAISHVSLSCYFWLDK